MPADVAVLALVLGTPVALLALLPAGLLFQRLMRTHATALGKLFLTPDAAAAVSPRVHAAGQACAAALVVTVAVALTLLFAVPPDMADRRIPPVVAPAAAGAGLLVLLAWPIAPSQPSVRPHPTPRGRWLLHGALLSAALLVALVLAAGFASVPDPPSPRYLAFPAAAPTAWAYDEAGLPTDIQYTPNGVTSGWPGWHFGGPILLVLVPVTALAVAAGLRVSRWMPVPAFASAADTVTRTLTHVVTSSLLGIGVAVTAAWVLACVGETLVAVSVVPRPLIGLKPGSSNAGHVMPLYALGQAARYAWLLLVPAAMVLAWLALLATHELKSGARAARAVLAAASMGRELHRTATR